MKSSDWRRYARGYTTSFAKSRIEQAQIQKAIEFALDKPLQFSDDKDKGFIPAGAIVQPRNIIAGAGTDTKLRIADTLAKDYGGKPEEWQKYVGVIKSDKYIFDIHWYSRGIGTDVFYKIKSGKERKR